MSADLDANKVIEMKQLACKIGHNYLLNNINWEVKQGERWAVYGMNGCGKTTLLSIIAGFKHYTDGSLNVFGETYTNQNALDLRKRIGFISSSFFDKKYSRERVLDIVLSAKSGVLGRNYDTALTDVKYAAELLAALHVGDKRDKQFDMLSKGERQSVLIARALFNEPELLILDEPCNGLDVYKRELLFQIIKELSKNPQITMVYVTQHIEEIGEQFDRTMLLRNGYVFGQGTTDDMFTTENLSAFLGYDLEVRKNEEHKRSIKIKADITVADILRKQRRWQ